MESTVTLQMHETDDQHAGSGSVFIDAGVERIHFRRYDSHGNMVHGQTFPSSTIHQLVERQEFPGSAANYAQIPATYVTGKLAEVLRDLLDHGEIIQPAAALWSAAQKLAGRTENRRVGSLAIIDLSASGYLVVGVDAQGGLKDDLLVVNPHCGAGTGANIDRVLQKLNIERDAVDSLLADYLGDAGKPARTRLNVRADRCGVFSSSATISDKNQGIPLDFALAVTLKSEVTKACKKLPAGFEKVYLTGGVFNWQYTRECAEDYLRDIGVSKIEYDAEQSIFIEGVRNLVENIGDGRFLQLDRRLRKRQQLIELPSFRSLRQSCMAQNLYRRLQDMQISKRTPLEMKTLPVIIGMDAGSTMAKLVIADAATGKPLLLESYSNQGDTIEIIKHIFLDLQSRGVDRPNIAQVGITGSARYQVQEALKQIFPQLKSRVSVLVENYAHAKGSIELAREQIRHLKSLGTTGVNEEFFILVDIGGEDTKLSTVSLKKGELFDNVMNVKCSAGTGSLMDSLSSLFGIGSVAQASKQAFEAEKAYAINATCAVFLIENARKLQTLGHSEDEILASCSWAIVENMARTLWSQVEIPKNAVLLLHGQTMLSDPLPIAVIHRMQEFSGSPCYGLIPPNPGHRACLGLIKTLFEKHTSGAEPCALENFIGRQFSKRIVQCRGAACGDKAACCNRTQLSAKDSTGNKVKFTLGGCTAVNELIALKKSGVTVPSGRDTYKEIWSYIEGRLPHSEDPLRLVIPRSFAVSEWAYFFGRIFQHLGLPVHTDNVCADDLTAAQSLFTTDTCAPQIGAVGQYMRLAGNPHGMILVPQIEFLPTNGTSMGRTCTINQGGGLVAKNLAEAVYPAAGFHLFTVNLAQPDANILAYQMYRQLGPVFDCYRIRPSLSDFQRALEHALEENSKLKADIEEMAADIIETALQQRRQIGLVAGREYILNPGIYDSHVGRLLQDKQIVAIPAYVLNLKLDPEFSHIYWRNPHAIVSVLRAVAEKKLHTLLVNPRLKLLFQKIERDEKLLPIVQVSTFRCGPDSVTAPLVAEVMKKRPFLMIQSDAVIKELAHLENRINTYTKQLELGIHGQLPGANDSRFEVKILDDFACSGPLDKSRDVIYLPTLSDNRGLTAAIRSAGITCIDNYDEDGYNLVELVKKGRRVTGDSMCAPLAAVYGDILGAVEDFTRRKQQNDPLVAGRQRVLVFSNKGSGPCRQGQYADVQKLFAYQSFASLTEGGRPGEGEEQRAEPLMQLLIGEEGKGYDIGLEEWTIVRVFQGLILQGVLHATLFNGGAGCRNYAEFQKFMVAYRELKQEIYQILEHQPGPGRACRWLLGSIGDWDSVGSLIKYFAYRMHNRKINRMLRSFSKRWIRPQRHYSASAIRIYVDGEAYMRASQVENIFGYLLSSLGFRRFVLEYAPIWCYLAYLLDEDEMIHREKLRASRVQLADRAAKQAADQSRKSLSKIKKLRILLRQVLARPLYGAAGINMPDSMPRVLQVARQLMPTLRPFGELGPYLGEILTKLRKGYDLCLNVAPEGCMVSSMGATLTPRVLHASGTNGGQIQNLFSADGDIDEESLSLALLKVLGPDEFYRRKIE